MSDNPFSSPRYAPEAPVGHKKSQELELVSQGTRFINYLIDRVLMTAGSFGVGLVFGMFLVLADPGGTEIAEPTIDILGFIIGLVFVFAYFVFFEVVFQRTPGKFLTGTRVVSENGDPPTFGQILGRTACRFIPFEAFSFLFGDSNRVVGWHDKFSGTLVVKSR